ncbi:unnamed protein product [Ilex paraguariensis]|uniref:Increased DNA methylation 1 C-terminal domain-containing protein n=1 Tax=Ilex paraguariensis TaxID=185542 RepID=A0ABC8S0T9_9AQUA
MFLFQALGFLEVEKMVIPAIAEHMHTWTGVFGFQPLEESDKKEMKSINMLVFPGTDMLQKRLVKQEAVDGKIVANSGAKNVELKENHPPPDLIEKSDMESSSKHRCHSRDDTGVHHVNRINEKVAKDSGSQAPSVLLYDGTVMVSSLNSSSESKHFSSKEATSCSAILEMEHTPLVKDNIQSSAAVVMGDAHEVNAKTPFVESVLDSVSGTSARSVAEEANGNQNPVSVSTICATHESTLQSTFELNQDSTVEMESKLHVTSEVGSNAEVTPGEGNIQSFVKGSEGDAHEVNVKDASVEPVFKALLETSVQSTTEKVNEKQNSTPVSTPHPSAVDMENTSH